MPLFAMNAFGQASVELISYNTSIDPTGNVLVIGKVSGATPFLPVKLTVADPSGKTIYAPTIQFDGNGNFKYLIKPPLPQFTVGTYTVEATHSQMESPVKLQFEVSTTGKAPAPMKCTASELTIQGKCMPYSITGATVSSTSVDTNKKSIVIMLANSGVGSINIKPSTEIIRGVSNVMVDGQDWDNIEINGNDITVMFPAGAQKIEIVGTYVVPEFGAIVSVILVISIAGILIMTARYRGLGSPRI